MMEIIKEKFVQLLLLDTIVMIIALVTLIIMIIEVGSVIVLFTFRGFE